MEDEIIYMYIKFGNEENLRKLQKGIIYCKSLQYYRDEYCRTGDKDMGDPYEGCYVGKINDKSLRVIIDNTNKIPVFCMYALKKSEVLIDGKQTLNPMKKFGKMVMNDYWQAALVITDNAKFLNRIKDTCIKLGIGVKATLVEYIDFSKNLESRLQEYYSEPWKVAFWKSAEYKEQMEYRVIFPENRVDDYFTIDIGDISDISVIYNKEELAEFMDDEYDIVVNQKEP